MDKIIIKGARENNLKNVSTEICSGLQIEIMEKMKYNRFHSFFK